MGLLEQDAPRHVYAIDHAFSCYDGDRYLVVLPYDGFRVTFTSINPHPLLGTQVLDVTDAGDTLSQEIAPARTVAFEEEIAQLRKMGLGLGGTVENVVVFTKDGGTLSKGHDFRRGAPATLHRAGHAQGCADHHFGRGHGQC